MRKARTVFSLRVHLSIAILAFLPVNTAQASDPFIKPEIYISPSGAYPGDALLVEANIPGNVIFEGSHYALKEVKSGFGTFVPLSVEQRPGSYSVKIMQEGKQLANKEVTIQPKTFSTQYLSVTKQQEDMKQNKEQIASDLTKVNKLLQTLQSEPLFEGSFIKPVEGRISTPYAFTRYVNGRFDSRHNAIDIAAPEGTPIASANSGRVILAEKLYLSGNRVMIDHGMGLVSSYSHLSQLKVKAGDRVRKGQIIGLVGNTGFSTGPHLHLAFLLNGKAVNPEQFFNQDPLQWK